MARKESAYNKFVGKKLKEGYSMKQAADAWSKRNRSKSNSKRRNPAGNVLILGAGAISGYEGMHLTMHFVDQFVPAEKTVTDSSGSTATKTNWLNKGIAIGVPTIGAWLLGKKSKGDFGMGIAAGLAVNAFSQIVQLIPGVDTYLGEDPMYLGDNQYQVVGSAVLDRNGQPIAQISSNQSPKPQANANMYLGEGSWEMGESWQA